MGASTRRSGLPEGKRLTAALATVFRGPVAVLERKPNPHESTFPTEIVICRLPRTDANARLFIKYGTGKFDGVYGHRGDVSYEARVYRDVLRPLHTSTPTFYGAYWDKRARTRWLITEYVERGTRISWSKSPNALTDAARWLATFHAATEGRLRSPRLRFLHRYDAAYYRGWVRRARQLLARSQAEFPWLPELCKRYEERLPRLLDASLTVIHGEFYPKNVIFQRGTNRPVDWQSAAVAAGEIDLAALTHFWPDEVARKCERAYAKARWPDGVPGDFHDMLELARAYMDLRWLGDPGWLVPLRVRSGRLVVPKKGLRFIEDLRSVAERRGAARNR